MRTYKVLWIDDEWEKMLDFKEEWSTLYHIELDAFATGKEGIDHLKEHLYDYDAVLLDAKVPWEKSTRATLAGLRESKKYLDSVKSIPYFISTGQPDLMKSEDFREGFGEFYTKDVDDEKLRKDMVACMQNGEDYKIRNVFYPEVFDAIDYLKMNPDSKNILLSIFKAMHFRDEHPEFEAKLWYNQLRQLIEYLFRACHSYGIIPDSFIEGAHGVNLCQCFRYVSGKEAALLGYRYGFEGDRIVPTYIENMLEQVLELGNEHSHTESYCVEMSEDQDRKVTEYLKAANSRYIIFSFAHQMSEVIIWFSGYIKKHPNDIPMQKQINKELYEGKIMQPTVDQNGYWHCGSCSFDAKSWDKRSKIQLIEVVDNPGNWYKFRAKRFIQINNNTSNPS